MLRKWGFVLLLTLCFSANLLPSTAQEDERELGILVDASYNDERGFYWLNQSGTEFELLMSYETLFAIYEREGWDLFHNPTLSPDARRIATIVTESSSDGNTTTELYLIDVETSDVTQVTNSGDEKLFPSWSSDGDTIAYCSQQLPTEIISAVNIVSIESGEITPVITRESFQSATGGYLGPFATCVSWASDGEHLLVEGTMRKSVENAVPLYFAMFSIKLDGTELRRLTPENVPVLSSVWDEQTDTVYYFSPSNGIQEYGLDIGEISQVDELNQYSYTASRLHPILDWSSGQLLYTLDNQVSDDGGHVFDLFVFNPDTLSITQVNSPLTIMNNNPRWFYRPSQIE